MTAKEYFRTLSIMEARLKAKKERLKAMRKIADGVGATVLTGMPRNPSPAHSQTADVVCRILALEDEIKADEEHLLNERIKALDLISQIENTDSQNILTHRYIQKESWKHIIEELGYSKRWVLELNARALRRMDSILEKEFRG